MAGRVRKATGIAYTTATPERAKTIAGADYGSKNDLTPQRYPYAISHDTGFHDALKSHIDELSSRFEASVPEGKGEARSEWTRMAPRFRAHIDAANNELMNSFAAHKHGYVDQSGRAHHTAVESYRRAATHLADAHKFILSEQGAGPRLARNKVTGAPITDESGAPKFTRQGISKLGYQLLKDDSPVAEHKLPTTGQLSSLVNDYQQHVRDTSAKNAFSLPKGVADHAPVKFDFQGEPSEEARKAIGGRGFALTAEEEIKQKVSDRARASQRSTKVKQDRALRRGETYTLDESGNRGAGSGKNPYAGVGFTGHQALVRAVGQHFAKTYPGQSFIGSEAHRDPISYASKHNVSLPSQESMVGKALNLMGERQISASSVMSQTRDSDPSDRKKAAPVTPAAKPSRSGEFHAQTGQGGTPNA